MGEACGNPQQEHGPDGGKDLGGSTNINALNGISGVVHSSANLFTVGVFLGSSKPDQTGQVDLSNGNTTLVQAPQLGQVFFIGDGHTASGKLQEVLVPQGAKAMYVGFADAAAFGGDPCCYNDNPGKLNAMYKFSSSGGNGTAVPTVPSSTTPPPPPTSTSSAPAPPGTTIAIDGAPVVFSFDPASPDPSSAGFDAPAGTLYLTVTQLTPELAQPFVRITVTNPDGTGAIAAPDFNQPGTVQFEVQSAGPYVLAVTPAGIAPGTVTVTLSTQPPPSESSSSSQPPSSAPSSSASS